VFGGLRVGGLTDAEIGSRKARTLLAVLLLARGAPVRTDRLADVLWGDAPPDLLPPWSVYAAIEAA